MNRIILLSLLAAITTLGACDFNDKYFEGYDNQEITDVVSYEGDYTGNYPAEGYFSDNATAEQAVATMLKSMFLYCNANSTAKVNILWGEVTPGIPQSTPDTEYTLTTEDYDSMGTASGQPGRYDNFDGNMDVDGYLTAFCADRYSTAEEGTIVSITYKFYASGATTDRSSSYQLTASGWEVLVTFEAGISYTLVSPDDYDSMGEGANQPGAYNNFSESINPDFYLPIFLKIKYPYTAAGTTCEVTYAYYSSGLSERSSLYKYDGSAWLPYDPYVDTVEIITKIAEMSFDGSTWKLVRMLGGSETYTIETDDYKALVAWVTENKPAYLSTQNPLTEEYYFGASSGYSNINNRYSTWRSYYDVEGTYAGKTDEEMQEIMDQRLQEAIINILLPSWVTTPDPGVSYVVVYKIYGGRGDGFYAMTFMYSEAEETYEFISGPVKQ